MKIISNTTPFIALSSVNELKILKDLYATIFVPEAVLDELAFDGPVEVPDISIEKR